MIIVVSDVHLGYDNSDKNNFNNFIDSELTKLKDNDHLVLLGDILEFWRKNCVDVTIEYDTANLEKNCSEGKILRKLYDLKGKTNLHYIIGNHDYSILYFSKRVDNPSFPFPFPVSKNLHLSVDDGDKKFYFIHGYEFEVLANFPFMTIEEYENICQQLCDVRETTFGKVESTLWSALHLQFTRKKVEAIEQSLTKPPEHRWKVHTDTIPPKEALPLPLLEPRNKIEELAMSSLARSIFIGGQTDETIIFGHTHSPFITKDKTVANSGSWVTDNNFHNTYITIDNNGVMNLHSYPYY
jgi:UDP-2,3-diacylglucosamine pyrophosphatase LpxH